MCKGTLYGISIGPGDYDLITLKAHKILNSVDIIAVPKSDTNSNSIALSIIENHIQDKKMLELIFPMSCDTELLNKNWNESAKKIINLLDNNKNVAFITLGDISIYSTFTYINKIISNLGYKVVIVPGVTSFCASAAQAKISLAENNDSIIIIPTAINVEQLEQSINSFDTIILMKFKKNFGQIKNLLKSKGLKNNTIVVEKCCMEDEKIYTDIDKISSLNYLSTMIIKKVI